MDRIEKGESGTRVEGDKKVYVSFNSTVDVFARVRANEILTLPLNVQSLKDLAVDSKPQFPS